MNLSLGNFGLHINFYFHLLFFSLINCISERKKKVKHKVFGYRLPFCIFKLYNPSKKTILYKKMIKDTDINNESIKI